jgi:hypothetical protein
MTVPTASDKGESIMIAPPIQMVVVFLLIVLLRRIPLGHVFVLSTLAVGIMSGQPPEALIQSMTGSVLSPRALTTAGIVGLMMVLSSGLESTGMLNALVRTLSRRMRHSLLRITVFPALVGLLPVPGGALFSAPLLAQIESFDHTSDPQ